MANVSGRWQNKTEGENNDQLRVVTGAAWPAERWAVAGEQIPSRSESAQIRASCSRRLLCGTKHPVQSAGKPFDTNYLDDRGGGRDKA